MINTRRILAVTSLSVLALGLAACSPKGTTPEQGSTTSSASPSASASQGGMPAQSGAGPQSGVPDQRAPASSMSVRDGFDLDGRDVHLFEGHRAVLACHVVAPPHDAKEREANVGGGNLPHLTVKHGFIVLPRHNDQAHDESDDGTSREER